MRLWGNKKKFVRIQVATLRPGMHVSLAERWLDHPFLLNEFTLESEEQIDLIRALGMVDILWCAEHSDQAPLPLDADSQASPPAPTTQSDQRVAQARAERKARDEKNRAARDRTRRAERAYLDAAAQLRSTFSVAFHSPGKAVEMAQAIIDDATKAFASDQNVSLVLLSEGMAASNLHTHGINVMLLSLLQARLHRLDAATMRSLALGALFHDLGKLKLPDAVRLKSEPEMNRAELSYMQLHTELGAKMTFSLPDFDPVARSIIGLHHEHWDGTGYPYKLVGPKIPLAARLVAIADRYDELSNPPRIEDALTPHQALVQMFKREAGRFETAALNGFIKALGVYPPGTLVELSNGALGLVMSVNRDSALRPMVVLWQDGIKPEEAPSLDLSVETELAIVRALRPAELAEPVREFLNPRSRTAYFYAKAVED
jgi:HD-GYP domain-containing protein (c-di-GMP phosphodiesterase class II)